MKVEPNERNRSTRKPSDRIVTEMIGSGAFLLVFALAVAGCGTAAGTNSKEILPMAGVTLPAIGLILLLMVLNALFVASEAALDILRPFHIKVARDKDESKADRIQQLLDHQQKYVAACSLGCHVSRLLIAFGVIVVSPAVLPYFVGMPTDGYSFDTYLLAALCLMIPVGILHLVIAELAPKSFGEVRPIAVGSSLFRFIKFTRVVFGIPASLVTSVANILTRRFGGKASFVVPNAAEEEIKTIVESAQVAGEIESDEKELLHSVFEFTDTVAREIMTPRVDLDALPIKCDPAEVVKMIHDTGHSRIPLYEESDDEIIGVIHAKDLFLAMANGKAPNLRSLMRSPFFVPENKKLYELLKEMRINRTQMAIVQDEFGGTAGIVTIEDIVEELVGDIVDEYDVERPDILQDEDGWLVNGKTHVDDVAYALSTEIDSEEFDTIGGYVFGLFGRQPKLNEEIIQDGLSFTVTETDGRRILQLRIRIMPELSDEDIAQE